MARNPKVELRGHEGQVVHPITDGDCVIFPSGETLSHKLSEQEEVMYAPEVTNSSPMFKVGEGDSSDYSANVLDGAYQEAVLKGQTYVNTIQEPSADVITLPTPFTEYERTQSKTFTEMQDGTFGLNLVGQSYVNCIQEPSEPSYVALGENLEFQNKKVEYTTDGQIKSAMLKGQTLVNLVEGSYKSQNTHMTKIGNEYKIYKHPNYTGYPSNRIKLNNIEVGKTYTFIFDYKATMEINGYVGFTIDDGSVSWNVRTRTLNMTTSYQKAKLLVQASKSEYNWLSFTNGLNSWSEDYDNLEIYLKNIVVLEGDHTQEDIPYFEGMQSVTMTTELENVCGRYNSSGAKNGKTFTVGNINTRTLKLAEVADIGKYEFKPKTKYLLQFKITNLNLDGLSSTEIRFYTSTLESGNCLFENGSHVKVSTNGIYRVAFTTTNVISTSSFEIKGIASEWEETTSTTRRLTISQIMCIEYQNGMENWDLPYFETTQLMKPLKVRTMSKNLCPVGKGQFFNCFFKAGTQFTLSTKDGVVSNGGNIMFKDKDGNSMWLGINSGTSLARTTLAKDVYQIVNQLNSEVIQYQLEEGSTSTDYVPHQSKTISALEPITLRAIGNVKDTLDLSTGEYVQRIGEIVLDGSEDEGWVAMFSNEYGNPIYGTKRDYINSSVYYEAIFINDKIALQGADNITNTSVNEAIYINTWENTGRIGIKTNKNLTDFKQWLSQNPIKVQYALANPITRKISLEYPNLQTYTDITHVQSIAMDGTLIPKIFLPSDISYKAMLKPNTSYNVIVDREVIDSTNQLTVNLGGTTANITANRTVVRTPSTLSNETLTFSGKDNRLAKAMLIEGSTLIDGDLPHFDGIGDVKLGRVVENLCMSNENLAGSFGGNVTVTQYQDKLTCKLGKEGSLVACFSLTKQLLNGKKYFAYCPWDCSSSSHTFGAGFRMRYNGNDLFGQQIKGVDNKKYIIFTIDEKEQLNPYIQFTIGHHGSMPVNTTLTFYRPIICEYIDGMENWDWESIGYFTGTRNIGNEFMRIGNKNLFDGIVELGSIGSNGENYSYHPTSANHKRSVNFINVKGSTQYSISNYNLQKPMVFEYDKNHNLLTHYNHLDSFTTRENTKYIRLRIHNDENGIIQLEESTSATSYTAHKHNSLHILPNEPIPLTFVQGRIDYTNNGTWANAINNTSTQVIRTQLLDLEPNETYRVSCGHSDFIFAVGLYNNSLLGSSVISYTSDRERYITTTKDVHKIGIATMRKDSTNITPSVLHQVRLEKVTDVTLRSVGDIKDELDLTRGVYIQRMYEVKLNGFEDWSIHNEYSTDNHLCFYWGYKKIPSYDHNKFGQWGCVINVTPLLIPRAWHSFYGAKADEEGVTFNGDSKQNITIKIRKDRLSSQDVNGFKQWLQSNPITVQYPLETPIEHKINIPMKNELNQTIAKPNGIFTLPLMHSETNHVDINSQIYPKVQSRDYISYPVIANNSQLHTVSHNKLGTGNLAVNLCGTSVTSVDGTSKCTITTPSTISQYELRLSGARNKVSNVCVFSGDYMNVNVPYVEGMMNAVNPIVKNVGRNLFDGVVKNREGWCDGKVDSVAKCRRSVNLTPVKPNTEYSYKLANGRGVNFLAHGKDGKFLRYMGWFPSDTRKFTTPSDCYYIHWYNDIDDFTDFYIEEVSTSSQYEPYKENICYVDCGEIRLTPDMFEQGTVSGANGIGTKCEVMKENSTVRLRSKDIIRVKPNTSYRLFRENGYTGWCVAYDSNKGYLGKTYDTEVFTTDSQTCYIVPVLRNISGATMTLDKVEKFRLVEVDETIHLRSLPNGVRDEIDLETGEYIQRIGEVVLDGSGDENITRGIDDTGYVNTIEFYINSVINSGYKKNAICDSYVYKYKNEDFKHFYTSFKRVVVFIEKTELLSQDVNGFKEWLSKNPITVQYELETPIIKQVDINNFPHSYKDGHVIIESNYPSTNVTAQMTYQCVANRTGQIQEHTEQVEKQEHEINELEMLILENIRQQQNR